MLLHVYGENGENGVHSYYIDAFEIEIEFRKFAIKILKKTITR